MARFADVPRTATLTGYNPLLQDFGNVRMLMASVGASTSPAAALQPGVRAPPGMRAPLRALEHEG